MNTVPPPRSILMLEKIRRRLRHAWLLHAWLIFSLLLLPAGRLARADGEGDVFTQTGTESLISVSVSAPEGTIGLMPGTTRQVIVNAQQTTWEVWTGYPSGTIETRNSQKSPMQGEMINFTMNGDGGFSANSNYTKETLNN